MLSFYLVVIRAPNIPILSGCAPQVAYYGAGGIILVHIEMYHHCQPGMNAGEVAYEMPQTAEAS